MKHAVPHALPMNLVRRASDAALRSYQQQFPEYKPTATWVSQRCAHQVYVRVLTENFAIFFSPPVLQKHASHRPRQGYCDNNPALTGELGKQMFPTTLRPTG